MLSQTIKGFACHLTHFRKESCSFDAPIEFLILGSIDEAWHKEQLIHITVKET